MSAARRVVHTVIEKHMKTLIRSFRRALGVAGIVVAAVAGSAQTPEGFVTRLPSAEQQATTAELRRSAIHKAQSLVDEARTTIANGAEPIAQARGNYEADPSAENAVNMIQACVEAVKNAIPASQQLGLAATSASRACTSQLEDLQKGQRELTIVLQHAGVRGSDLKNLAANYDAVVERLRSRFAMEAELTPTQESLVRAALFNAKLSRRTAEHTDWSYGELLAALKELEEAKKEIEARALGFQRQAQQAQMVRGHFQQALANFESVLTAWKTTGESREFGQQAAKLHGDIDDTLEGLADVVAEGMPTLPPSRQTDPTGRRGQSTLERLLGTGAGASQGTIEVVNEGGDR